MEIIQKVNWPKPGKYVLAISGGVDSVALLDLLKNRSPNKLDLVVAHTDHGWRSDSKEDSELVQNLADEYGLEFDSAKLRLKNRSEAEARVARYNFLESVRQKHKAKAIITAHHYDDQVETAIMNLMRGSDIYGLTAMKSSNAILRPLLQIKKLQILDYAKKNSLKWREDSTNSNLAFFRNRVRLEMLPKLRSQNHQFDAEFGELLIQAQVIKRDLHEAVAEVAHQAEVFETQINLPISIIKKLSLPVLGHIIFQTVQKLDPAAELNSDSINQLALQLKTGRLNRLRKLNNQLNVGAQNGKLTVVLNQEKKS